MASTKIFHIGKWDESTGLHHYATTWQILDNLSTNHVILQENQSTTHLNTWNVNLAIPTNKVYYVRALRHFKDSNGNIVSNNDWIGPEPIINTAEIRLEPLKPIMYIEQPYVKDIYVDINGLHIILNEPDTSVPHLSTDWIIKHNGEKFKKNGSYVQI